MYCKIKDNNILYCISEKIEDDLVEISDDIANPIIYNGAIIDGIDYNTILLLRQELDISTYHEHLILLLDEYLSRLSKDILNIKLEYELTYDGLPDKEILFNRYNMMTKYFNERKKVVLELKNTILNTNDVDTLYNIRMLIKKEYNYGI